MSETKPRPPVDEYIKVIDYENVYKTDKWWCAIVLGNQAGHMKLMIFLWKYEEKKRRVADANSENGFKWVGTGEYTWKRKQKASISSGKNWARIKEIIDGKFIDGLPEGF